MEQNQIPALPEYQRVQKIRAAKIMKVEPPAVDGARIWHLYLEADDSGTFVMQPVPVEFIDKHFPMVGDYFARHSNGESACIAAAEMEEEFSRAPEPQPATVADLMQRAAENDLEAVRSGRAVMHEDCTREIS